MGDLGKLLAGKAISTFGSGITADALPLTALLYLGARASDMGWLLAVESAPVLVIGMFAGVWVDRVRRRPMLIGADLARAALLVCIPVLAALGNLRIEHLFAVGAAAGALTVVFDVAYRSFVPSLSQEVRPTATSAENRLVGRTSRQRGRRRSRACPSVERSRF